MPEMDLNKLKEQAADLVSSADQTSSAWGRNLSHKRVEIRQEHLNVMEEELLRKLGDDVEMVAVEESANTTQDRPTNSEDAVEGVGGYKLDTGKPRWELAPFDAFEAMVLVQTWAVDKNARGPHAYPERNWERGMSWSRVFGAMIRHAWKWWFGKMSGRSTIDDESGMSHIWHAFTCAGFLVAYELRGITEFDDRPNVTPDKSESSK
jgi:hypothetical protein